MKEANQTAKQERWPKMILRVFLGLLSCGLLVEGGYLAYLNLTAAATSTFSFGFLTLSVTLLSEFKRFEGFGFKAEMWDQEQVKAAQLLRQLRAMSSTVIEQLAIISGEMGLASGGGTIEQREELVRQLEDQSDSAGLSEETRRTKLSPLYNRLYLDYCRRAESLVTDVIRRSMALGDDHFRIEAAQKATREVEELRDLIRNDGEKYIDNLDRISASLNLGVEINAETGHKLRLLKSNVLDLKSKLGLK